MHLAAAALLAALQVAPAGGASGPFPFEISGDRIDFEEPQTGLRFKDLIETAEGPGLVYIDWELVNFSRNEVFDNGTEPLCAIGSPNINDSFTFSGRPDADDNHFLVNVQLRNFGLDPFLDVHCQEAPERLTIRGFFHVTRREIPTAYEVTLRSVEVEPALIPKGFFSANRPD
jgi:hypothetical protein